MRKNNDTLQSGATPSLSTLQRVGVRLLLFVLLLVPNGCGETDHQTPPIPADQLCTVEVKLDVPGMASDTRAVTDTDMSAIKRIYVICFDAATKKYKARYRVEGGIEQGTFKVSLPKGDYKMMFVANPESSLTGHIEALTDDDTWGDAANNLILEKHGKWALPGTDGGELPMFGTAEATISGNATIPAVRMTRMHARVDVTVSDDNFKLTSVRVYRYSTNGKLVHRETNDAKDPGSPVMPYGSKTAADNEPLFYGEQYISDDAIKNSIFLLEADNSTASTPTSNFCLVIEGEYNGEPGFYRVDLATTTFDKKDESIENTYEYMKLVRNIYYTVNIARVLNKGYGSVGEALDSTPFTSIMVRTISAETDVTDIVFDKDNYLGISRNAINLGRGGYPFTQTAATHGVASKIIYSETFTLVASEAATVSSTATWLNVQLGTGNFPETITASHPIAAKTWNIVALHNTTEATRSGTITLTVEGLERKITVTQAGAAAAVPTLNSSSVTQEFLWIGTEVAAKTIQLDWASAHDLNVAITQEAYPSGNADATKSFDFGTDPSHITVKQHGGWGKYKLNVKPNAQANSSVAPWNGNKWVQKCSKIEFKVGSTSKKSLAYARQLWPYYTISDTGGTYTWTTGTTPYKRTDPADNAEPTAVTITTNVPLHVELPATHTSIYKSSLHEQNVLDKLTDITADTYVKTTKTYTYKPIDQKNAYKWQGHNHVTTWKYAGYATLTHKFIPAYGTACGDTSNTKYLPASDGSAVYEAGTTGDNTCMMLEPWGGKADDAGRYVPAGDVMWSKPPSCPPGWRLANFVELDDGRFGANQNERLKNSLTKDKTKEYCLCHGCARLIRHAMDEVWYYTSDGMAAQYSTKIDEITRKKGGLFKLTFPQTRYEEAIDEIMIPMVYSHALTSANSCNLITHISTTTYEYESTAPFEKTTMGPATLLTQDSWNSYKWSDGDASLGMRACNAYPSPPWGGGSMAVRGRIEEMSKLRSGWYFSFHETTRCYRRSDEYPWPRYVDDPDHMPGYAGFVSSSATDGACSYAMNNTLDIDYQWVNNYNHSGLYPWTYYTGTAQALFIARCVKE